MESPRTNPKIADAAMKIVQFAKDQGYPPEAITFAAKLVAQAQKPDKPSKTRKVPNGR